MNHRVPFSHPHDHERAGLRDYLPRPRPARWPRWIAVLAIGLMLGVLAIALAGCAWHYPPASGRFTPESPAPDATHIAQLAAANVPLLARVAWLRLSSPWIQAGAAVRLTCFVPRTPELRNLQLGLVDEIGAIRVTTHAVNFDEALIQNVPCGSWLAVCNALGNSNRVLSHQEQQLTARGTCNDAGPGGDR